MKKKQKLIETEVVICDFCGISEDEYAEIAGQEYIKFASARPGLTGDIDLCPYCKQMMSLNFSSWSKILHLKAEINYVLKQYYEGIDKCDYLQKKNGKSIKTKLKKK